MAERDLLEGDALDDLAAKLERDSDSQFGPSMVDVRKLIDSHEQLWSEHAKLLRFKTYVHERLDAAGVEKEPSGPHSAEGCRVGDRLDIALIEAPEALGLAVAMIDNLRGAGDPDKTVKLTAPGHKMLAACRAALAKVQPKKLSASAPSDIGKQGS